MKTSRLLQVFGLAVLCTALLAGCGAMSKGEYEKEVSKIGKEVDESNIFSGGEKPTKKDLEEGAKALNDAADELDGLNPPEEVADLHDDFVEVVRDLAKLMENDGVLKMAEDPEFVSSGDGKDLMKEFTDVGERMEKVQKGFEKKDYDIDLE